MRRAGGWLGEERTANEECVDRPTGADQDEADDALHRLGEYLIRNHVERRDDEYDWNERIEGNRTGGRVSVAASQPHGTDGHEREEDPFGINHAREQHPIAARAHEHRCPHALQSDRTMWRLEGGVNRP